MESLSKSQTYEILFKFIEFAALCLKLDSLPKFNFMFDDDYSVANSSFGGYGSKYILIMVKNRHVIDVCRTLAHELVHYKQDLEGRIEDNSGDTGSPIENEANAEAAVIMRKWGKAYPHLFSAPPI